MVPIDMFNFCYRIMFYSFFVKWLLPPAIWASFGLPPWKEKLGDFPSLSEDSLIFPPKAI